MNWCWWCPPGLRLRQHNKPSLGQGCCTADREQPRNGAGVSTAPSARASTGIPGRVRAAAQLTGSSYKVLRQNDWHTWPSYLSGTMLRGAFEKLASNIHTHSACTAAPWGRDTKQQQRRAHPPARVRHDAPELRGLPVSGVQALSQRPRGGRRRRQRQQHRERIACCPQRAASPAPQNCSSGVATQPARCLVPAAQSWRQCYCTVPPSCMQA